MFKLHKTISMLFLKALLVQYIWEYYNTMQICMQIVMDGIYVVY